MEGRARVRRGRKLRQFVMVELGAGCRRWSLETIFLAKRLWIKVRSIAVEAEPSHCEYLKDAFWELDVPDEQLLLVEAAISEEDGEGYFLVGNNREWWGQALTFDDSKEEIRYWNDASDADDLPIHEERVPVLSVRTLIEDEPIIDLINFDIQGAEYLVIKEAISLEGEGILDRVKSMTISTHNTEIEHKVFAMLCSHGWQLVFFDPVSVCRPDNLEIVMSLLGRVATPSDGIKVWVNPLHVDIKGEFGVSNVSCSSIPYAWPPIPLI